SSGVSLLSVMPGNLACALGRGLNESDTAFVCEFARPQARKRVDLAREMGFVAVASARGELGVTLAGSSEPAERPLEPREAREQLGPDADPLTEQPLELALADTDGVGERAHAERSVRGAAELDRASQAMVDRALPPTRVGQGASQARVALRVATRVGQ